MIICNSCSSTSITELDDERFTHQCDNCGNCFHVEKEAEPVAEAEPEKEAEPTKPKKGKK